MTQSAEQDTIWLTQEAFDKLAAELDDLKGPQRQEVVARISAARDEGDLKENGGYHAAREEQGKLEGRIRELEDKLERAQVGSAPVGDGTVGPGTAVTILMGGDESTYLLGSREMKDTVEDVDVLSPQSPLGEALLGRTKGDTFTYTAPNGKDFEVEVVDAEPYAG